MIDKKPIKAKVSLVITNYNGLDLLKKNLPSAMEASKNIDNSILEIILVDDASTDESVSFVKNNFPKIKVIQHKKNRGFVTTTNTGVRSAKGEFVCLLNNDVKCKKNFLEPVLRDFDDKNVFGVSLHEAGFGPSRGLFEKGFIVHRPQKEFENARPTFWVSGGSGVFRRDLWLKVGWLDDELFSPFYWEDVDISYRALKRGFKLLWEPMALVSHQHEQTTKNINKKLRLQIQEKNQLLFIWKNLTSTNLIGRHIAGLTKRMFTHPGYIFVFLSAASKIRKVIKARKKEKKEAIVADEFIFASFKK
jgi:GT2 family glycosyltransferase